MKICFLEGDMSRRGGTERMTALMANMFSVTDQVWIISLALIDNRVFFELDENVQHSVLSTVSGKFGMIRHICEIRKVVCQNQIDWLINVDIGTCIYGIPAVKGTKTKVITWEHSNFFNNWNSRVFPYFRRFAAKHSDALVVLTDKDKKNYQNNIKSDKPVYVIPNPSQRHEFYYDAESKIILSAGLLLPVKGYDRAIQVAEKVLSRHLDWRWIILGEGSEREHLEQLITEFHLESQVLLPGTVYDMDEQYQKAAMYVMTSETEGLPMVLLEAKSWGLPIISFDIMTGPSDIIRDGINGCLVPPYDVDAMAEKIEGLIENRERRIEFSENSQLDMEKFDLDNILGIWREVMEIEKEKNSFSSGGI